MIRSLYTSTLFLFRILAPGSLILCSSRPRWRKISYVTSNVIVDNLYWTSSNGDSPPSISFLGQTTFLLLLFGRCSTFGRCACHWDGWFENDFCIRQNRFSISVYHKHGIDDTSKTQYSCFEGCLIGDHNDNLNQERVNTTQKGLKTSIPHQSLTWILPRHRPVPFQ